MRRLPPTDGTQEPGAPSAGAEVPAPTMPGGSPGYVPSASTKIHFPGVPESKVPDAPPTGDAPKAVRFEVYDCPKPPNGTHGYRIIVNGMLGFLLDGKTVDATTYDVDALRRQGVKLRKVRE